MVDHHDPVAGLLEAGDRARLEVVLTRAREAGFLGPGPVADHVDRSLAMAEVVAAGRRPGKAAASVTPAAAGVTAPREGYGGSLRAMDLGSGGGVPGLVLAMAQPTWRWTLLDGSVKRTAWLVEAVDHLGLEERVDVVTARAEEAGRSALRGVFDVVVARSFAAPAPTAECAAPLLREGGALIVTEPPGGDPGRWDPAGAALLGMELDRSVTAPVALQVLRQVTACGSRYPRRTGVPVKRPLW